MKERSRIASPPNILKGVNARKEIIMKGYNSTILTEATKTIDAIVCIAEACEHTLKAYVEAMPNGKFVNGHNDDIDTCMGIVLTSAGDVCPIGRGHWCLNPLNLSNKEAEPYATDDNGDEVRAWLSTWATGAPDMVTGDSVDKAVANYNRNLREKGYPWGKKYAIVAYWEF